MTDNILIPLKQHDQVEELIPYLEFVARPGMQVVFLIQTHDHRYPWWLEHGITSYHKLETRTPITDLVAMIARQQQSVSAEARISRAREVLQAKKVTTRLEFCSVSLRSAMRSYYDNDADTIILRDPLSTMQFSIGSSDTQMLSGLIALSFVLTLFVPSGMGRIATLTPLMAGIVKVSGLSDRTNLARGFSVALTRYPASRWKTC